MKKFFYHEHVRFYILSFLALGFFITTGIFAYQTKDYNEFFFARDYGVLIDFNDGWIDEEGREVNLESLDYKDCDTKDYYLFHRIIPDGLLGEESLCFEVKHMGYAIYFDDREYDGYEEGEIPEDMDFYLEEIDESAEDYTDFDKSIADYFTEFRDEYGVDYIASSGDGRGSGIGSRGAGTYLKTMQMYSSDSGDTIYLQLFPVYKSSSISNIMIEPANAYIRYRILSALPKYIICLIIIITGVVVIVISIIIRDSSSIKIYEALSVLIILVGSWSLIETHFLDYILGTSEFLHTISYFLLMSMAYPVALFSDTVTLKPHKKMAGIVFWITVSLIIVCTFLNYNDIWDFHDSIILSDALIMITGVIVIVRIIADQKFRRDNDLHVNMNWINVSLAIVTLFGFADLLTYFDILKVSAALDNSFFTRIGVLIFTAGMFVNVFKEVVDRNRQADKAGTYMEMAFTDALTGIPNRGAFLLKESELADRMKDLSKRKKDTNFQIVYIAFDLNGLKIVNDTLGHAKGDDYIIAAAGFLMQSFAEYGYVYRIGGDEFASFIASDNAVARYEECIGKLIELIKGYNASSDKDVQMHIAYGYGIWQPGDPRTISQIEKEGDEAMYEKKRLMKKEAAKYKG